MPDRLRPAVVDSLRLGRNGIDPPHLVRAGQCVDAVNVEWYHTGLGRKRQGTGATGLGTISGPVPSGTASSLYRHVPSTDDTAAELWYATDTPQIARVIRSAYSLPTLQDAMSGTAWVTDWASFSGKLFVAYPSTSGFTAPAAPTAANTGAGTYAATSRRYRVRWVRLLGTSVVARSAAGSTVTFVPSGGGTAARVTQPTPPGQGETHWELEVSYDAGTTWYVLFGTGGQVGATVIATTTADDSYTQAIATTSGLSPASNITARQHVWDGNTVRRTGLIASALAPTAANTGGGAYTATLRYYRTRWIKQAGGVTVLRSEASPSVTFTPSGAGTGVVVTRPALIAEVETHWELEGSSDNVTFYVIYGDNGHSGAAIASATTTATDTLAPSAYSTGTNLSASTGTYTLQKPYRLVAADQGRVLGFGSWLESDPQNDLELSAVSGSLNVGDSERVDTTQTYRYTLDENDSGAPTALKGPVFGNFYAFKPTQTWELAPTGLPSNPYRRTPISKVIGCVQRGACAIGEDAIGNQALYFMSRRGLYRYGVRGLEYIGHGIEDYVLGPTAVMNLNATNVVAWVVYYPRKKQVYCGWAISTGNDPTVAAIYDVQSGGWSRIPVGDAMAAMRAGCLFADTWAAGSFGTDLKPFLGGASGLLKADTDAATTDSGTPFKAYVVLPPVAPGLPGYNGGVGDAILLAEASAGVTITATVTGDFGLTSKTGTALLTASGSETHVSKRIENSALGEAEYVTYQLGDASAVSSAWSLERLVIPCESFENRGN